MTNNTTKTLSTYLFIALLAMGGFNFVAGWDKVSETEYGLSKNWFTGSLNNEEVYTAGMHFTGVMSEMIIFPKTQQTVEFTVTGGDSITGRTQDGLAFKIDLSFQYQLLPNSLVSLYRNFGEDGYEQYFIQTARSIIRDVASLYSAIEFFSNRTSIGLVMETTLRTTFNVSYGIDTPALQLRQIDLPDDFEQALKDVEIAKQKIEEAKQQQAEAIIRAQTAIIEAQAQANITLVGAKADADAFVIIMQAQADALNITLTQEANSYYALSQALNFTSAELLSYLWIMALMDIGEYGNLVIIGDDAPSIILDKSGDSEEETT